MFVQYNGRMLVIGSNINMRNIILRPDSKGEWAFVLLKNGEFRSVPWCGLISKQAAKKMQARPVKIRALRWGYDLGHSIEWQEIPDGKFLQGCLTGEGVYAVVDSELRIV